MKCSTTPVNPCPIIPNAKCVVYTGPNLTNINVTTNMRLDTILETLNNIVNNFEFELFTEDTVTLDLSGDGSSITPLFGDVNISDFGNNAILTLEDGLYVPNVVQNGVVLGGIVTWLQDYDYHVSPAVYYINGVLFDQRQTFPSGFDFTLTEPDGTFNRLDTFVVDVDGETNVLEGTPSSNPAQAPMDTETQLELSIALVEVGTTEPTIDVECLYKNNVEGPLWTNVSSNTSRINPDSTLTPCNGTKSIEGTTVVTGDNILFTRSSNFVPGSNHSLVTFLIKSKGFSGNNNFLRLQWEFNGTPVGTSVALRNFAFSFDGLNTSTCQIVSIPFSFFGITTVSIVNSFRITGSVAAVGGIGFFIDDLCLQGQPLPDSPTNVDEKVKVSSNDTTAGYLNGKLVAGAGVTFVENNNGSNETLTISVSTTLSADNGLSESPTNNIQLGGNPLIQDSVISTSPFHLTIIGSSTSHTFQSDNSGASGSAIVGISSGAGGAGIVGSSTDITAGFGGSFQSQGGIGVISSGPLGSQTTSFDSGTNTVIPISTFLRTSSGTSADGIGGSLDIYNQTDGDSLLLSNQIISRFTDVADLARTSELSFTGHDAGTLVTSLILNGEGSAQLPEYGAGNFTGTATFILGVDTNGNVIEEAIPGAGFVYTADNGLSEDPANNFQLGGNPLLHDSLISTSPFKLTIESDRDGQFNNDEGTLVVINTHDTGQALSVQGEGTGTFGLWASVAGDAQAIHAEGGTQGQAGDFVNSAGSSYPALSATTANGSFPSFTAFNNPAANTNNVIPIMYLSRGTTGTAAAGIGESLQFRVQAVGGASLATTLISKLTDVGVGTEKGQFIINGIHNSVTSDWLTISSTGSTRLNKYGIGTFTGTPTYAILTDASGNLIEGAVGGGGLVYTADNGLTMTSNNTQLGGTLLHDSTIDASTFELEITGANALHVLGVTNTGTGIAGEFDADLVSGTAVSGIGLYGGVFRGLIAVQGLTTTDGGLGALFEGTFTTTNTLANVVSISRASSAAPAAGIGAAINFEVEGTAGIGSVGRIGYTLTDVGVGTVDSSFHLYTTNNSAAARTLSVSNTGQLTLDEYGSGTITGTPAFALNVDASGNVIEAAIGAGMTNPMSAEGDIIISDDGAGTPKRLAAGTAGFVLTSNGANTEPSWQAAGGSSGITRSINSVAVDTPMGSAALTDYIYFVSGTTTVTLPTAVGNTNLYTVSRTDATLTTTIDTTGGQTIDGDPDYELLSQYESVTLASTNSNWIIVS